MINRKLISYLLLVFFCLTMVLPSFSSDIGTGGGTGTGITGSNVQQNGNTHFWTDDHGAVLAVYFIERPTEEELKVQPYNNPEYLSADWVQAINMKAKDDGNLRFRALYFAPSDEAYNRFTNSEPHQVVFDGSDVDTVPIFNGRPIELPWGADSYINLNPETINQLTINTTSMSTSNPFSQMMSKIKNQDLMKDKVGQILGTYYENASNKDEIIKGYFKLLAEKTAGSASKADVLIEDPDFNPDEYILIIDVLGGAFTFEGKANPSYTEAKNSFFINGTDFVKIVEDVHYLNGSSTKFNVFRENEALSRNGVYSYPSNYNGYGSQKWHYMTFNGLTLWRDNYMKGFRPVTPEVPNNDTNRFGSWGALGLVPKEADGLWVNLKITPDVGSPFSVPLTKWTQADMTINKHIVDKSPNYPIKLTGNSISFAGKEYEIENQSAPISVYKQLDNSKVDSGSVNVGATGFTISLGSQTSKNATALATALDNKSAKLEVELKAVAKEKIVPTGEYVVPEWSLSRYWGTLVPEANFVNASSILSPSYGNCGSPSLSPSGSASFNLISPTGLPVYFRSLAKLRAGDTPSAPVSIYSPVASKLLAGDLLAIKTTADIDNHKEAQWVSNSLGSFNIPANYKTDPNLVPEIQKSHTFDYKIYDKTRSYTNTYGIEVEYCSTDDDGNESCYTVCEYEPQTISPSEAEASYDIGITFQRHLPQAKFADPVTVPDKTTSVNSLFTYTTQGGSSFNIYPEVPMLFDNQTGGTEVKYVVGDYMREIKPVSFHLVEWKNKVNSRVQGTSALDSRVQMLKNALGLPMTPVYLKGASLNTSYNSTGVVEAKSFTLDIAPTQKTQWGQNSYNSEAIHTSFLSKFNGDKNTTPVIAQTTLKTIDQELGTSKRNDISIVRNNATPNVINHTLEVRAGKLVSVNGQPVSSITGHLKTALEEMGLLNGDAFKTLERGTGAVIDNPNYVSLTKERVFGTPWYAEDTTSLILKEYTTTYSIPSIGAQAVLPLNVNGLATPINKNMFFSQGKSGHTKLEVSLIYNGTPVSPFFVYDSSLINNIRGTLPNRVAQYIIPNVSVLDSIR
jgi:hypothetical protein